MPLENEPTTAAETQQNLPQDSGSQVQAIPVSESALGSSRAEPSASSTLETPQEQFSLREVLNQQGANFQNDREAAAHLFQVLRDERQKREVAEQTYWRIQQERLAQEQQRQQPQQQAQQPQGWQWKLPEWNQQLESQIVYDRQGNPVGPQDLLQKKREYQLYRQQFAEQWTTQPDKLLGQMLEGHLSTFEQKVMQKFQEEMVRRQIADQVSPWALAKDPATGQVSLSPIGSVYNQAFESWQKRGADIQAANEIATMTATIAALQQQLKQQPAAPQQPPATPVDVAAAANEQAKQTVLQRGQATRKPNVRGSGAPQETQNNDKLPLHEQIMRNMKANGVALTA